MRVRVTSFPGSTKRGAEEAFRDSIAGSISQAIRSLQIADMPVAATIEFLPAAGAPQTKAAGVGTGAARESSDQSDQIDFSSLVSQPRPNADALRLPDFTFQSLQSAIRRVSVSKIVYEDWGLKAIDPIPRLSLNFAGPPGTGKTLAAHFIARQLGRRIIEISYADIVSKYFGEAARNLARLYDFASRSDAILFVDEAETLLSRRSAASTEGADHAVNSMRSQLLILMEKTPILSIFASNLLTSYDDAFISRLITVQFQMPDLNQRQEIWKSHLPESLPLASGVSPAILARRYDEVNGRQIARAVIEAAHRAAILCRKFISAEDFDWAVDFVRGPMTKPSGDLQITSSRF